MATVVLGTISVFILAILAIQLRDGRTKGKEASSVIIFVILLMLLGIGLDFYLKLAT